MSDRLVNPVSWNRLENNECLYCGEPLLEGTENEMGMHIECRKEVEEIARKQIAQRKEREGKVKRIIVKAPPGLINKKP